ncbi:hypothetical protein [Klenkia taihuensis]|uniref:Uncharacterized protein n=1 Tax=Klenkia taihuensis TaxID=1225127 RepID=A0A1I1U9M6_9ACTN|nr:hypothetical protein [Klenkia taihuensis]GHE06809.1 hypothetical protein GCM10011381_00170 [Klenkia taihuensis]SFD67467.1 hypothetical protein SAMN05661030_3978 [Klenkia taihuensis]
MSAARRAALALLAVLGVLLGTAVPATAADGADGATVDRVVVVGVPGLTWADVDPTGTPALWQLAGSSSIGALSVRAARSTTCVLDGWATLGAGNRARWAGRVDPLPPVPLPDQGTEGSGVDADPPGLFDSVPEDTSLSYCGLQEQVAAVGLADPQAAVELIADDPATARFGAQPAALSDAVGCAVTVGRAATVAAAGGDTRLTQLDALPTDPAAAAGLLENCPLSLLSLDQLLDAGTPGSGETDTGTDPLSRPAALGAVDNAVAGLRSVLDTLPGNTLLLVDGVSEVNDGRPQLHVAIAHGPGFDGGWLSSSSTGRAPFVQLIDAAPTALAALGVDQPASMNGQPMTATGERPALADAIDQLEVANERAVVHYRSTGDFFWALVLVGAAVVGLGLLTLGGWRAPRGTPARWRRWWAAHRPGPTVRARLRRLLRPVCLLAASLPVSTYLASLVPWQDAGSPRWALAGSVAGIAGLLTAVGALGPWRRRRLGPALVVLAVSTAVPLVDVATGSHLELDGLLGYDAIVAGRFTGYGNLTFGLMPVSTLLLVAAVATALARRAPTGGRRRALVTVLAVGVVVVGFIGTPALGRDFGGVIAAVPGFLLLAMLLGGIRVTVTRLVAVLAVAVLAVGSVAVLDWTRPPSERSHLGRFVAQVLDGQAWTVVSRKAVANVDILLGSPLAWTLAVAAVAAVWLVRPGGLLRSRDGHRPGGLPPADLAVLRAALLAVALSLVVAAAVNDSGVAIPATAATLLVPLLVWLAAAPVEHGGGDPVRVSVSARGSTD